jgi:hypothetical protein
VRVRSRRWTSPRNFAGLRLSLGDDGRLAPVDPYEQVESIPLADRIAGGVRVRQAAWGHQLTATIEQQTGSDKTVLSAAKEVEEGARAMLVLVPWLFRLDVHPDQDTMGIQVRNLSDFPLEISQQDGYGAWPDALFGELEAVPSRFDVRVVVATEPAPTVAAVTALALRRPAAGSTRFVAQAIVRPWDRERDAES